MTGWSFLHDIGQAILVARRPYGFRNIDTLTAFEGQAFPFCTPLKGGWLVALITPTPMPPRHDMGDIDRMCGPTV